MGQILLLNELDPEKIKELHEEFHQYQILSHLDAAAPTLLGVDWEQVEVLYTSKLSAKDLKEAHQLRWIHVPSPYVDGLPIPELRKRENILVTNTKGKQIGQMGEYVMAAVYGFGKDLFCWRELTARRNSLSADELSHPIWHLENKTFLQIGLGMVGTEITRRAKSLGMRVWGVKSHKSFHPHCEKIFSPKSLHTLLPAADVVCFSLPRGEHQTPWFGEQELELMKEDSLLIEVGGGGVINEEALCNVGKDGKFRGIVIDTMNLHPPKKESPLWKLPRLILTPGISPLPSPGEPWPFRIFRYNLRQYIHGNYSDLQNLVQVHRSVQIPENANT